MLLKVSVVVQPDGDGFHAYCPAFKGLHIDGGTVEETLDRTVDALQWYLNSLEKYDDPLPVGVGCVVEDGRPRLDVPKLSEDSELRSVEFKWPHQNVASETSLHP